MKTPTESQRDSQEEYRRIRELLFGKEQRSLESVERRLGFVERGEEFLENHLEGGLKRLAADDEDGGAEALAEIVSAAAINGIETGDDEQRRKLYLALQPFIQKPIEEKLQAEREHQRSQIGWLRTITILLAIGGLCALAVSLWNVNRDIRWSDTVATAVNNEPDLEVVSSQRNGLFGLGEREATVLVAPDLSDERIAELLPDAIVRRVEFAQGGSPDDLLLDERLSNIAAGTVDLVEITEEQRAEEMRDVTKTLFYMHFGEIPGVTFDWDRTAMRWMPKGTVDSDLYEKLRSELPRVAGRYEVDFAGLRLEGEDALYEAQQAVEEITIAFEEGTDSLAPEGTKSSEALLAAVAAYEEESQRLGLDSPKYEPRVTAVNAEIEQKRIERVELLLQSESIPVARILPGVEAADTEREGVFIKIVQDR